MNIVIIGIRGLPANYGGFETCAENTSSYWVKKGHNVLVYCRWHLYDKRPDKINGVRLKYVSSVRTKSLDTISHSFLCLLDLILWEKQYRYVHLYNTGNAIFIPILKLLRKKVIISVDGIEWKRKKWGKLAKSIHKLGEKIAVKYADRIVTDNKVVEAYYKEKYNKITSTVAYGAKMLSSNYQNEDETLQQFGLKKKEYSIFVGRLVPEKGVHHLIDAYKKLKTSFPLVIIGDDNENEYRNSLFSNKSGSIIFTGYVYGTEYEILLKNAYLYVSASELEGTSPSLLAAMGAEVCALVNGIDENRQTIQDCAYCFEVNNFDDLRETWQRLLDTPDLITEMSKKGYNHCIDVYNWDTISQEYLDLFGETNE